MSINYNTEPLLHVEGLKQHFRISRTYTTKAVDGISFDIWEGETYGLVGESGSGKSTTGRALIRLYDPTAGKIIFDGHDISGRLSAEDEKFLRQNMQMIFQDPMACLNPRKKVRDIIAQGLEINHLCSSKEEIDEKVYAILDKVGLSREHATRYPQQFSGGQRQRIGIARALVMNPKLVIADEAISALDVSIQAQVVNLMRDLQDELGITYMFIAHDLSMVKYISDRPPRAPRSQREPGNGPPAPASLLEKALWVPPPTEPFRPGPGRKAKREKERRTTPMTRAPPL